MALVDRGDDPPAVHVRAKGGHGWPSGAAQSAGWLRRGLPRVLRLRLRRLSRGVPALQAVDGRHWAVPPRSWPPELQPLHRVLPLDPLALEEHLVHPVLVDGRVDHLAARGMTIAGTPNSEYFGQDELSLNGHWVAAQDGHWVALEIAIEMVSHGSWAGHEGCDSGLELGCTGLRNCTPGGQLVIRGRDPLNPQNRTC